MLKRLLIATALLFSVPFTQIRAADDVQVAIPKEGRVLNTNNRQCVLCSVELLGRHAKDKRLYDLSTTYVGPLHVAQLEAILQSKKVEYKMNARGNKGLEAIYDFLVIPCQYDKRGVAVGVDNGRHMLNVVHYDIKEQKVLVIDNSDPKLEVRQWDWTTFHQRWDGWAVVIYAEKDPFVRHVANWKKP